MPIAHLIHLKSVDSTNSYALQLLRNGSVAEGTVIVADDQTAGKGQGENTWNSEPGKNATFSMVLFPVFLHPGQQFQLNIAISLGVLDFLRQKRGVQNLAIKWPNDIYAGDRKIGGILIQNTVCGNVFESCIAGVGVNINQESFAAGLPNPVSLVQITGKEFPVAAAVELMAGEIEKRYQQLQAAKVEFLNVQYRERLYGIDTWRIYKVDNTKLKAMIRGVDESGLLEVLMEDGSTRLFNHGEIEFLLP